MPVDAEKVTDGDDRYDAGPQIKIWEDELSGMVKTLPEICEECVDRE